MPVDPAPHIRPANPAAARRAPGGVGPAGALGADVEALDVLAAALAEGARVFDALTRRWRCALDDPAPGGWTGPDARRVLGGARDRLLPAMAGASRSLAVAAATCRRHAGEQRRAAAPAPAVTVERWSRAGDGRVVRRVGAVDARVVVAVVPGVGSDGGDADRLLADALRLHAVATVRRAGSGVAVITWLGYDPPDTVPGAVDPRPAGKGADTLARDVARWRHAGADRVVLVGHSYGAVVAGRAAAEGPPRGGGPGDGSGVDVLVQLGSPGAGPPGPAGWRALQVPGLRWVAARAARDPIALASPWALPLYGPDPVGLAGRLPTSVPGHGGYLRDPVVLDAVARLALLPGPGPGRGSGARGAVGYGPRR